MQQAAALHAHLAKQGLEAQCLVQNQGEKSKEQLAGLTGLHHQKQAGEQDGPVGALPEPSGYLTFLLCLAYHLAGH